MKKANDRDAWGPHTLMNLIKAALVVVQSGLFLAGWLLYYRFVVAYGYFYWGILAITALYLVLYTTFSHLYGGFLTASSRAGALAYSLTVAAALTDIVFYCVICLLAYAIVNPLPMLVQLAGNILVGCVWAQLAMRLHDRLFPPCRTYLIYDNEDAYRSVQALRKLDWKFDFARDIKLTDVSEISPSLLDGAEAVILCGLPSGTRNTLLKLCVNLGIPAYVRPKIGDLLLSGSQQVQLANLPFLYTCHGSVSVFYGASKRALDVLISGLALVVLSPVLLLTALAVRLEDGGPAFYKQCRLTQNGKEFYILKFRSMRVDAEKDGVARLSTGENDDRITKVGRFIRKCRLDELPQLINILKGEMSIVGPRPERPEIAAQYEAEMPEFRLRLQAKAGLTGYAQVYGKYNTDPYDKLEMDLMYIAKRSLVLDLALMFATVKVLFMAESTEGVTEGQTTAAGKH